MEKQCNFLVFIIRITLIIVTVYMNPSSELLPNHTVSGLESVEKLVK